MGETLQLWWGAELGVPNDWRWHKDYRSIADSNPLADQRWFEYKAGVPARLVRRRP